MKNFKEMTPIEKAICNEQFILEGHKKALEVLKAAKLNYWSELVMINAIEESQKWLNRLQKALDNGGKTVADL